MKIKTIFLAVLYGLAMDLVPQNQAFAAEEEVQLDSVTAPNPAPARPPSSRFSLMGRIDLTSETTAADRRKDHEHQLENKHLLIFLKVMASEKTSFMGEIVGKSFYFASYRPLAELKFDFGKIIVPFGDTRRFHLLYGGLSTLNGNGIMLPQVWAESGLNAQWRKFEKNEIDLYWVDSIQDDSTTQDPDLHAADEPRKNQAGGFRWMNSSWDRWTSLVSYYRGEYQSGKPVEIAGLNLYSEYGAFSWEDFRWAFGVANAWIHKAAVSGDFQKRGDYFEMAKRVGSDQELCLRYGTYLDNDQKESVRDLHSFSLSYLLPVDVSRLLLEYQWNFEAVNETNNDLFRAMLSLDF